MHKITVKDIIKVCNGILICGAEQIICENFCKDTRLLNTGDIYLGIKGKNFDGNELYKEAFNRGASVCILDNISSVDINDKYGTIIKVDNTVKALQQIAKYKRSLYDIPVIGITGSVGKTSTKDIIASVVSTKYKVLKTEGNFNNEIGMPLTILKLKDEEAMVLEMGTDKFGDLSLLTSIAKPTICVFTIIGTSHIANFGSRKNILKGKMEMLEGLSDNGTVILNNDNDLLNMWYKQKSNDKKNDQYNVVTYGIDNKSSYMANDIRLNEFDSSYQIQIDNKMYNVKVPVGGKHFIYNSLAAFSVGRILDIPIKNITQGIEKFELTKMRMDINKFANNIIVINDTYNASLDSMKSTIDYISKIKDYKKIVILGDMLELGNFSEQIHREVGKYVYDNGIDKLITIGNDSKYIADEAIKNGMNKDNVKTYSDNVNAINKISNDVIVPNSIIAIKASRGMHLEEIYNEIKKILEKGDY